MVKISKIPVNLRLFDGEAEGVQAGSETTAAIASQLQSEVVVYGRETDTDSEQTSQEPETPPVAQEEKTPDRAEQYKKFKEEFKNEFTSDFDAHFNRRFKDYKTVETKATNYEPIVNSLMKFHGVNTMEELSRIIDQDYMSEIAAKEGFSDVNKYKEHVRLSNENQKLTQVQREALEQQDYETKVNGWINEGIDMKAKYPDFDLSKEMENKEFAQCLGSGMSVEKSYKLVHMEELLSSAKASAAKSAEKSTVENIKAKGQRILENGVMQTQGVVRKTDPSKFTDADFKEIERRVARGEKIVL